MSEPIQAVITGIVAKVEETTQGANNTFYTAIGGRFYDNEAPPDETFPYAVVYSLPAYPEYQFSKNDYIVPITVNMFSNTRDNTEIDSLISTFKDLFYPAAASSGWKALTLTGFTQISLKPEFMHRFRADEKWQGTVELSVRVNET